MRTDTNKIIIILIIDNTIGKLLDTFITENAFNKIGVIYNN